MKKNIFFFICAIFSLTSAATPPVDISFLVADLKYNEKQGVKICEVQQASLSMFKGYDYIYKGEGLIGENLCQVLAQFGDKFWFVSNEINYKPMKKRFLANGWRMEISARTLLKNSAFIKEASKKVDSHSLFNYPALVYMRPNNIINYDLFLTTYPGVVVFDRANKEYWKDKYKMSTLFLNHPDLEAVKPRWGLFPKKYTPDLAGQIRREIPSQKLVIKPKGGAEGLGVIILESQDLDETLKTILKSKDKKSLPRDKGYTYWNIEPSDTFLVEEYIESDPIRVAEFGNRLFNCTMRVVFALIYHEEAPQLHFLGEYWILPDKAIDEAGTLNDKNKASMVHPHITAIDPETRIKVKELLTRPFLLMYKRMLELDEATLDEGIEEAIVTGLDREI